MDVATRSKILGTGARVARGGSVIPFEKEFVEVGDEEAEQAPYSQDGLDGCEPRFVRACDPGKQGEP